MSLHDSQLVADDEHEKSTDRGYEVSMPQSQLWFVNQRVSSQPRKQMNGAMAKRGRSILPSVKVAPGGKTSQDFNLLKSRQKAMSYRPGLRSGPGPSEGNTEQMKSRNDNNILHLQNRSYNDQLNNSTATNNEGLPQKILPLNRGQNRGKFNQLKSLL